MWEQKNTLSNPITFDEIDSNKILHQFFSEHKLDKIKNDALYTYCLLYKNDIPFIPIRNAYDDNLKLREKGIILQYFKSDFCFFPHKEYAKLIFDSFTYIDNGISTERKYSLIQNYIHYFDTSENKIRIGFILTKLQYSEDKEIIGKLLNDEKVASLIQNEIKEADNMLSQVINVLNIIYLHSENVNKKLLEDCYNTFLSFFNSNKLSLFVEGHYLAYTRLIQISSLLNIKLREEFISVVLTQNEVANTNSIVELTLRISRKNRESQTILRILHSYTFPEWLEMIIGLPKLSNITNSLSELNTSFEAKKLLAGLIRNIDWETQYRNAKSLKIDQFVISLRAINKIDVTIGSNISKYFFQNALKDSLFKIKFASANLSEYSKALSDLSKLDSNFVKNQLSKDLNENIVFEKFSNELSISNFTARALELRKHFEDSIKYFEVLNEIVLSDTFIQRLQTETNLNYLLIFTEFAEKYLNFEDTILKQITSTQITNVIAGLPNKLEALSNPKFLNIENLDSNFIDSISPKQIEKYFESNKITYAEDLFRVLSSIDKVKTIQKFKLLNRHILSQAFLDPELNYSQALENINKLKNKVYKDELINGNIEIIEILSTYLSIYTKDFRRYKRVGISDYFKGYYFGLLIDRSTIERYCKSDFLNKISTNNHNNIEIASVFQFLRRISEETNGELNKELSRFLELNTDNFIQAIRNEDITKTLSGLSELALTKFDVYGDGLLFLAKKSIIKKVEQRKKDEIYLMKLIPDLEKIAKNKGKRILKELKK